MIKRLHLLSALCAVFALLLLAGCASMGPTPEQMKAMEGLSSSLCIKSPGWNGSSVDVHYASFGGKSTGTAGGSGKATCGASVADFQNEGRLPASPRPVTPPAGAAGTPNPTP